jgi:hypothetical protein
VETDEENQSFGQDIENLPRRFEAGHVRHLHVENDEVGTLSQSQLDGGQTLVRFGTNRPARARRENFRDDTSGSLIIVCNKKPFGQTPPFGDLPY